MSHVRTFPRRRSSAALALYALVAASGLIAAIPVHAQQWQPAPTLPTGGAPREYAAGFNAGGTVYALGGTPWVNGNDMDGSVHALPLGATSWTTMPPLGGMGPIIHQGAGVDRLGRIVVYGGLNIDNGDPGQGRVYDPADGPSTGIADRSSAAPDENFAWCRDEVGYLYSLGGGRGAAASQNDPNSAYCERYDAISNAWQPIAAMPMAVAAAAAVYDGQGHILVVGGIDATATTRLASVLRYDIATNEWSSSAVDDLPVALSNHRAVLGADDRVYVLGGVAGPLPGGAAQTGTYVLDLASGTWSVGPEMATARYDFAAALGGDDYIYVIGGRNDGGGTDLVEKLYTTPCPSFLVPPASTSTWVGQTIRITASVGGGTPMDYQWRKGGVDLGDGPKPGGGTISGATTTALKLTLVNPADEGVYTLVATNACGAAESPDATLYVLVPPTIPQQWTVTNLHPAWALGSTVTDVEGDTQVGHATMDYGGYSSVSQPVLWHGSAESAENLRPANSVGGAILATRGGRQVGWWWWPYQCYYGGQWHTCYTRQACEWSGTTGSHVNRQVSGYEYSLINGTDGVTHVGTATYDDESGNYYSRATVWNPPGYYGYIIHPSGVSNSALYAVAEGRQFGTINTPYPGPVVHAAMWSGSAGTFVDMNPAGAIYSGIAGARDGQAVGTTDINVNARATLWSYEAGTDVSLHPAGASASAARRCMSGLQVGYATFASGTHAVIWAGTAESMLDLHAAAGPAYSYTTAYGIDVGPDETITVVGAGYNTATGRTEALMWRSGGGWSVGDMDCDGDVDFDDIDPFVKALEGQAAYEAMYPDCEWLNADVDGNGSVDFDDIDPFVGLLTP